MTADTEHATLKAIVQREYGSYEVLHLDDVDRPTAADDEVLVRVRAAAVNYADWGITTGLPYLLRLVFGLRRPKVAIRGRDVAGTVEAVGSKVTRLRPGDEVYGEIDTGSFAEFTCASERLLAPKPANLTFEQAAAVPVAASTALQGLRDVARLRPGQSVLINGATGGVGTFAVQIAKAFGAYVTGVCSSGNVDLIRSLGADDVIDYGHKDFTRTGRRYDVIFDLVGNHPLSACRRRLNRGGTLVLSSGNGSRLLGPIGRILRALVLSLFVSQRLRSFVASGGHDDLEALTDLIEAGAVTPAIDRTYALIDTPEAIRYFGEGHARAKLVITV